MIHTLLQKIPTLLKQKVEITNCRNQKVILMIVQENEQCPAPSLPPSLFILIYLDDPCLPLISYQFYLRRNSSRLTLNAENNRKVIHPTKISKSKQLAPNTTFPDAILVRKADCSFPLQEVIHPIVLFLFFCF